MTDRELDAAVAERVMGWLPWDWTAGDWDGPADTTFFAVDEHGRAAYDNGALAVYERGAEDVTRYFAPSTDIAAAWLVVERVTRLPVTAEEATHAANTRFGFWWDKANLWAYTAEEAARAICLAALEACP